MIVNSAPTKARTPAIQFSCVVMSGCESKKTSTADKGDGLRRQVLAEMIVRVVRRRHRRGSLEQGGLLLVHLAAEEPVEALEAIAGRPAIEWTRGAGFPYRRLMHLAECRRVVAVQLQDLSDRGRAVRPHGRVAWKSCGESLREPRELILPS